MTQLLKEAMRLHQSEQMAEAEMVYRQILAQSPEDVDALHYLGVLLHQRGNSRQGSQLIRKAIKRQPGYVDAHKNLGNVLMESGRLEKAEQCYRKAIQLRPDDTDAQLNLCIVLRLQKRYEEAIEAGLKSVNSNAANPLAWFAFGKALKAGGMTDAAIAAFYRAINLNKEMVEAHNELCHTLYRAEKVSDVPEIKAKERIKAYQDWLKNEPDNPVVNFMLAACLGDESISRMPDEVVRRLFDGFAASFDQNLSSLDYRVPELVKDRLRKRYPNPLARMAVLDAGCGTGLCAPFLRPLAGSLLGVDLSAGMIKQARRRNLYDDLQEAELTRFLQETTAKFDLVTCADTLVYFGDLGPFFKAVAKTLQPGGLLIFSVEHLSTGTADGYQINTSGRYSHTTEYVRGRLKSAGLSIIGIGEEVIRRESSEPVRGLIVEAENPRPRVCD